MYVYDLCIKMLQYVEYKTSLNLNLNLNASDVSTTSSLMSV